MITNCKECNKEFEQTRSTHVFCSKQCKSKEYNRNHKKKPKNTDTEKDLLTAGIVEVKAYDFPISAPTIEKEKESIEIEGLERLYTIRQLSEYLCLSVHETYKLIKKHDIKTISITERNTRITEKEVKRFIKKLEK